MDPENDNEVFELISKVEKSLDELNELTVKITEIPAPPFREERRAGFIQERFEEFGYNTAVDEVGNVIASKVNFSDIKSPIVFSAHLDTVFETDPIKVERRDGKMYAPGVGDDSRGLACLLILAKFLFPTVYSNDLVFVATVGEEGRGDLRGVKHLFSNRYSWRPLAFITIDGTSSTRVVDQAIGSRRFRAFFTGPGGHSFGSFGTVNPLYALGSFMSAFSNLVLDPRYRSTYSLGVTGGGTSINAIPEEVWVDIDLRSEVTGELSSMVDQVKDLGISAAAEESKKQDGEVEFRLEDVGNRPAGKLGENHLLRSVLSEVHDQIGIELEYAPSSTDANVPLSLGIAGISVGGVHESGRAHTQDEWIDASESSLIPVKRNLLLAIRLVQHKSEL